MRRQRYRYTERRIHRDQPLYTIGWYQTLHATSAEKQQRDFAAKLLSRWKQDYDKLLGRFDLDRNGEIDQHEWERARKEAAKQARDHVTINYEDRDISVLSRPASGQAYILSTSDPDELSTRFRHKTIGLLAGAGAAAGFSIWFALHNL